MKNNAVMQETLIKKGMSHNADNVKLEACGTRVIFLPYEDNPYWKFDTTEAGVILGADISKKHLSDDSGEMEDNELAIVCAKVISVGQACR